MLIVFLFRSLFGVYSDVLLRHPVFVKAVTSALAYLMGDMIAQVLKKDKSERRIDSTRMLVSCLAGGLGHGPLSHMWYKFSEAIFTEALHWSQKNWWVVLVKVLLDQTIWCPLWKNLYFIMIGLLNLEPPAKVWLDCRRMTMPYIRWRFRLWPFVNVINYRFVPLQHRLLFVDVVEVVWVTVLAAHLSHHTPKDKHEGGAPLQNDECQHIMTTTESSKSKLLSHRTHKEKPEEDLLSSEKTACMMSNAIHCESPRTKNSFLMPILVV
jgi:protein Mpv17